MNDAELTLRLNQVWVNRDPRFKDLTGKRFGRLTALRYLGSVKFRQSLWLCRCDCGRQVPVEAGGLSKGNSTSCGCLQKDRAAENLKMYRAGLGYKHPRITHGLCKSQEYSAWYKMKSRCLRQKDTSFKNYGGRGIKICDKWLHSFENFIADMGVKPSPKHSLGRTNNDGDYTPDNCRWETRIQQQNNTRGNVFCTLDGKTQTVAQWANEFNVKYLPLAARIRSGWPIELAITTPLRLVVRRTSKSGM